jgi:hypothetical protein
VPVDLAAPADLAAGAMAAAHPAGTYPPAPILDLPLPSSAGGGSSPSLPPLPAVGAENNGLPWVPRIVLSRESASPGDMKEKRG